MLIKRLKLFKTVILVEFPFIWKILEKPSKEVNTLLWVIGPEMEFTSLAFICTIPYKVFPRIFPLKNC